MSYEFKFVIKYYQSSQMVFPLNNPWAEIPIDKLSLGGCMMNEIRIANLGLFKFKVQQLPSIGIGQTNHEILKVNSSRK